MKLPEKLVFPLLDDIDVRKAMENCAAEGFSHQSLESLKEMITDFVLRSALIQFFMAMLSLALFIKGAGVILLELGSFLGVYI